MKSRKGKTRLGKGRKSWARIRAASRLAEFWGRRWAERKERWLANPETRDKEMAAIFRKQKDKAKAGKDKRRSMCHNLPDLIPSRDINEQLRLALERDGKPYQPSDVHRLKVYLCRDRLLAFDAATLTWAVAKR